MEDDSKQGDLFPLEDSTNKITKTTSFALAEFSEGMALNQQKLYAYVLSQVSKDDDPDDITPYEIDIHDLADQMGQPAADVATAMSRAAKKMPNPELYFEEGNSWVRFPLFSKIKKGTDRYKFSIAFSPDMKRIFVGMKKQFNLIYPNEVVAKFTNVYSQFLYDYLLSRISTMSPEGRYFRVSVTPEQLMVRLNYKSKNKHVGAFNRDTVLPAALDVSTVSEMQIKDDAPEVERFGRKIVNYVFFIEFKPGKDIPLATYTSDYVPPKLYNINQVPNDDYLSTVMRTMGIDDAYIKYVIKEQMSMKTWSTILYTKIWGKNSPMYFNKAYKENYAANKDVKDMIAILGIDDRNFRNPVAVGYLYLSEEEKNMRLSSQSRAGTRLEKLGQQKPLEPVEVTDMQEIEDPALREAFNKFVKNKKAASS